MVTISFTLADDANALLVAAFAAKYGYSATLPDGTPNPQTPAQFTQAHIVAYCKGVCKEYAQASAKAAAVAQANAAVDAIAVNIQVG